MLIFLFEPGDRLHLKKDLPIEAALYTAASSSERTAFNILNRETGWQSHQPGIRRQRDR